jgi:transcriptional regulator with XRE-family HTH domain
VISALGDDLRDARIVRGLRQADVARAAKSSHAHVSRLERGVGVIGVADLSRHGAVVGLRLHARFYPTGGGLRDAAQLDLIRRFRARIGDRWRWQLEVPLDLPGDLRAFDAVLGKEDLRIAVEAITRLSDAQAQLRTASLKQREGQVRRLILLISGTHHNRRALATAAEVLATAFPLSTRATLAALAQGHDPGDNGIVLL